MDKHVNNVVQEHLHVQVKLQLHVLLNLLYQEEYVNVLLDKDQVLMDNHVDLVLLIVLLVHL